MENSKRILNEEELGKVSGGEGFPPVQDNYNGDSNIPHSPQNADGGENIPHCEQDFDLNKKRKR